MNAELVWVLGSSGKQVQPQIITDPDYPSGYRCICYDYEQINPEHDICGSIKRVKLCC